MKNKLSKINQNQSKIKNKKSKMNQKQFKINQKHKYQKIKNLDIRKIQY